MLKFGDTEALEELKRKRKSQPETARIIIDMKMLIKIGVDKATALNLMERLLKLKK